MQIDIKHPHDSIFKNLFDERKVMLFEYIAIKKDMSEEKFNEIKKWLI